VSPNTSEEAPGFTRLEESEGSLTENCWGW